MSVKSSTELMLYVVLTMPTLNKAYLFIYLLIIIGTDCICKWKSSYHNIAAMLPLLKSGTDFRVFFNIFARNRCSLNNANPQLRCRVVNLSHVMTHCIIKRMCLLCHLSFKPRECEWSCVLGFCFASVPTIFRLDFGIVLTWDIFSVSLFYPI
jgi:hypothetical protein